MNISSTVRFDKNWELENGKKIGVLAFQKVAKTGNIGKPEDHWSYIAHLSAEDMLKSVVTEEKKIKNIESE